MMSASSRRSATTEKRRQPRHAFELALAEILEDEAGTGDEIPTVPETSDFARAGRGGDTRADADGESRRACRRIELTLTRVEYPPG